MAHAMSLKIKSRDGHTSHHPSQNTCYGRSCSIPALDSYAIRYQIPAIDGSAYASYHPFLNY
jgi:hypothetical protein